MDFIMDASKDAVEPAWLEKDVVGDLRVWQIMFMCFAVVASLIVMVCCCFRFRIPRTKQQIQADYQRRKITSKFRQRLESIQDTRISAMSLQDGDSHSMLSLHTFTKEFGLKDIYPRFSRTQALELLNEKRMEGSNDSQPTTSMPPQQTDMAACSAAAGDRKPPGPQSSFAKFANKVAVIAKLAPKPPTSPTPSGDTKMDF